MLVLGNTPVWLVERVQTRAHSQTEGYSGQWDRELDIHPYLVDQRSLDSARMAKDPGSVCKPVVEGVVGIHIHTESLESVTPVKRATWKVAGMAVVLQVPGE